MVMDAAVRAEGRATSAPLALIALGTAALGVAVYLGRGEAPVAVLLVLLALLATGHRLLARWEVTIGILLVVILFIPIKRYAFGAALPFDLEPYRIFVALAVLGWAVALLVDRRVALRGSDVDAPLLFLGFVVIVSVALNADIISGVGGDPPLELSDNVAKELLFLLSFFLVFYLLVSVLRSAETIHAVLKTLVLGATIVAMLAILERRTGYNAFNHLGFIPLLDFEGELGGSSVSRGGRLRVYGPAQHPIALAAMLVMVVPVAVYFWHRTRRWLWLASAALLTLAALATVSRTAVVMLAAVVIVSALLRRAVVRPLLIAALPVAIAIHLVVPGAIGSLRGAFFPPEGLIQDQTAFSGRASGERLAPQFERIRERPLFGQGYGTRVTRGLERNARILDNQWLGTAVEIGLLGVAAWVWLFVRFLRRSIGVARRDLSGRGSLLTALASSVLAFALGMLTYDAFSFIQVTVVFFVLLAIGASVLAYPGAWPEAEPDG